MNGLRIVSVCGTGYSRVSDDHGCQLTKRDFGLCYQMSIRPRMLWVHARSRQALWRLEWRVVEMEMMNSNPNQGYGLILRERDR